MKLIKLMACAALAVACTVGISGCKDKRSSKGDSDSSETSSDVKSDVQMKVADGTIFALALRLPTDTALAPLVRKYGLSDINGFIDQASQGKPWVAALFKDLGLDKVDLQWMLVTIGGDVSSFESAEVAVVAATTLDLEKSLNVLDKHCPPKEEFSFKKITVAGVPAFELPSEDGVTPCVASLGGNLIIGASSAAVLEKQIALHRDGKGESSDFATFTLAENGFLHVKAAKAGEILQKISNPRDLREVNNIVPGGDKILCDMGSAEIALGSSSDGASVKLDVTVYTASQDDAKTLDGSLNGFLKAYVGQLEQSQDDDNKKVYEVLKTVKVERRGKGITLSALMPAEPILETVSEKIK